MKKYVLLAMAAILTLSLSAQQPVNCKQNDGHMKMGPGMEKPVIKMTPEQQVEKLAKHVELTDAEKADLLNLFKKQAAKREDLKKEFDKLKEKGESMRKDAEDEMEKIIGHDKFKKLQADRIENLQKMNHRLMMKQRMMRHGRQMQMHGQCPMNHRGPGMQGECPMKNQGPGMQGKCPMNHEEGAPAAPCKQHEADKK